MEHRFDERERRQSTNKRNGGHGNTVSMRLIRVDTIGIDTPSEEKCIAFVDEFIVIQYNNNDDDIIIIKIYII